MTLNPVSPNSSSSEYSDTLSWYEDSESISSEVGKSPTDFRTSSQNLSSSSEDRFTIDTDIERRSANKSLNEYETEPKIESRNELTHISNEEQNSHNTAMFRSSSSSPLSVTSGYSINSYKPLSRWSAERVVEFLSKTPVLETFVKGKGNQSPVCHSQSGKVCRKHIRRLLKLSKKDDHAPSKIRQMVQDLEICCHHNINTSPAINGDLNDANSFSDDTNEKSDRNSPDGIEETSLLDPTAYNFGSYSYESDKNMRSSQLCDEDFLEHMVRETNRCALVLKTSSERFVRDWCDVKLHKLPLFLKCNRNNVASLISPF